MPLPHGLLAALREATRRYGVLLIFDEVITGFRWSPGGAQARYGIVPDLTVLAKILAGGLPGGAVAGAKAILDQIDAAAAKAAGREKIGHQGTFNANPLCAAAGIAMLSLVQGGDGCARAEAAAAKLREGMRKVLIEEGVPWGIFGEASVFVIFPNPRRIALDPATFDPLRLGFEGLKGARDAELNNRLRIALLAHGVDIAGGPGGFVSAAHGEREILQTVDAFRSALRALRALARSKNRVRPYFSPKSAFPQAFSQSWPSTSSSRPSSSWKRFGIWNIASMMPPCGRPRLVPAAGRAPNEITRLALALAAHQASLQDVGLLDQHVLVVRQPRARRELHQRSHDPALAVDEQRLHLDAGEARFLPRQLRHLDEARRERRKARVVLRVRRHPAHALRCSPALTIFIVLVPPALPIGSPIVSTIRSPSLTTRFSNSTFSASISSSSRSWPTYFTISG